MPLGASFPSYDRLSAHLASLVGRHPDLISLETIGRSHRGRDVWLVTLTDRRAGPPDEKRALYMDGIIHAEELTAGAAVTYLLDTLVAAQATDERVARMLRRRTFYLVPRVNPDGAEYVLTTPYPWMIPASSSHTGCLQRSRSFSLTA